MGTAIARPIEKIGSFQDARNFITQYQTEIQRAAVAQLDPQILASAALNSVRRTPLLLACTKISFLSSLIYCAVTGLVPDTPDQECHLIPFKNRDGVMEVQWIGGFRGFQKLARQSGLVTNIETATVYEKDKFYYRRGLEPRLDHEPALTDDRGKAVAYYVVFRFGDISYLPQFEVMGVEEVKKIRAASKASNGPAWVNWFDEQGRKSVFKRGYKWIPKSSVLVAQAIELDDRAVIGEAQALHPAAEELLPDNHKTAADRLADKVGAPPAEPEPEPEAPAEEETAASEGKEASEAENVAQGPSGEAGQAEFDRGALVKEIGELEGQKDCKVKDLREECLNGILDLNNPVLGQVELTCYRNHLQTLPDKKANGGK